MKIVATPWNGLSKFLLFVFGIPLTMIGIVFFITQDGNLALLINGLLWLIIGISLKIKGVSVRHNLESLKREGRCYMGSVVNILPAYGVRIGSYVTACVECAYESEKDNCLIKSGYYLLSPFDKIENLYVKIYFDYNNSEKHAIELYRKDN